MERNSRHRFDWLRFRMMVAMRTRFVVMAVVCVPLFAVVGNVGYVTQQLHNVAHFNEDAYNSPNSEG